MIRWSFAAFILCAGPSQAMLQCIYYDEDVAAAATVVQIAGPKVSAPDSIGNCTVSGPVARAFAGAMAVGDWVDAVVPCDNAQAVAGPSIYTDPEALAAATVIELHLTGQGVAGYGAGIALLDALTETPAWTSFCGQE